MKEKIRIFVCNKCCNTAYTTDGSIPDACTSQYWVRTSGICGGHYSEIEGADFGWVVNQEVEKRIAERMPSEDETQIAQNEYEAKEEWTRYNTQWCFRDFIAGVEWLRSRLTCSEKPNNSQKTEGGEG